MRVYLGLPIALGLVVLACSSPSSPSTVSAASTSTTTTSTTTTTTSAGSTGTSGGTTNASLPAIYTKFGSGVKVTFDGTTVTLVSNTTPDHKSPYWGVGNPMYEAPKAGMQVNPNLIVAQTLTLRVPANPTIAASASDTPLGPMGMALNGVPLFNQYAAGRVPLTTEIISFDQYDGHPQQSGEYHYHMEPYWLTTNNGASSLIGVLVDGFPVYGPKETNGSTPTGLDSCNGHTHATTEVPAGIYHYHITTASPYISGCYKGNPGSVG